MPSEPGRSAQRQTERSWNMDKLGWRMGVDAMAAASAGALVAPVITMIDRGIVENSSGRNTLGNSIRGSLNTLLFRPHRYIFSKPFGLIFALYTGTYLTANTIDTFHTTVSRSPTDPAQPLPLTTTTAGPSKFLATSAANLALCLYKDSHFTKLFGAGARGAAAAAAVPRTTYALFALRDCLTIFASFNAPPLLAPYLGLSAAQFAAPAAAQLFSTPLHLLGLDAYNVRGAVPAGQRWRRVRRLWLKSCVARVGRIVPAFGLGGVVNLWVRREFMSGLDEEGRWEG
ncbi:hypothetical protein BDY21DRAFT_290309 [Lineolata rhizophorae]|uniref:Sequence orphan n=1 Tax=Lineolata rhizophorae TaxID=578093 RepID=A0A6A6NTK9_9PEZI|nr:hypothetical protein BDY21DRAFT_290309 [Lineolata rhizophorae]